MKNTLLYLCISILTLGAFAQEVPNGNFENPINGNDWVTISGVSETENQSITLENASIEQTFNITTSPKALQLAVSFDPIENGDGFIKIILENENAVLGTTTYTLNELTNWKYISIELEKITLENPTSITIELSSSEGGILKADGLKLLNSLPKSAISEGTADFQNPSIKDSPYTRSTISSNNINSLDGSSFSLKQNSPNPFNRYTLIKFNASKAEQFTLTVKNILGQEVVNEVINASRGENSFTFGAENLRSGTYFYTLSNNENSITKKLVVKK